MIVFGNLSHNTSIIIIFLTIYYITSNYDSHQSLKWIQNLSLLYLLLCIQLLPSNQIANILQRYDTAAILLQFTVVSNFNGLFCHDLYHLCSMIHIFVWLICRHAVRIRSFLCISPVIWCYNRFRTNIYSLTITWWPTLSIPLL